jgi:hypothetical protein
VRKGFLALAEREPERFRRVRSGGSPEGTYRQVSKILAEWLGLEPEVKA